MVLVSDHGTEHEASAGSRNPTPQQRFRVGSVTKTFTATVVLQLLSEGRLGLSDTLGRYVPDLPLRTRQITIRQLLNHRSGLANYTDDFSWLERVSKSPRTRPIDLLRYGASQPLLFTPGTLWRYSNTNYIALGLVIEKITGDSYRHQLHERLLDPLHLDSTELPTTRHLSDLNDRGQNPNVAWAAGALVSNTHDLAAFFSALLSGEILSDEQLSLMKQTVEADNGTGDGLGIFSTDLPCGRFWGHSGLILDYGTLVQASDDGERVTVISAQGPPAGTLPDPMPLYCPTRAPNPER
jgi:D-alanyl-D-alanine carboxypeptidase